MQRDLFRSGHELDLRSNFQKDPCKINERSFDASHEEEYDVGKMNAVSLLSQKSLQKKNCFAKTAFLEFLLTGGQTVDLRSKLRSYQRKSV